MDQVQDKNFQRFWKLSRLFELPDFVKSAQVAINYNGLHSSVFADSVGRQFPCQTKPEAWTSYLYYLDSKDDIPPEKRASIESRFQYFSEVWNLEGEFTSLSQEFEKNSSAPELSDQDYALVVEHGDETIKRFPVCNAESVKVAAKYLWENRGHYPYEWRKTAARNLLKKAEEYGAEIPSDLEIYLERASGFGTAPAVKVASVLYYRTVMLNSEPGTQELQNKLASAAKFILNDDTEYVSPDKLEKIASIVDAIDTEFNWNRLYTEGLSTPEEAVFGFSVKLASEIKAAHIRLTTGAIYKLSQLSAVSKDVYSAALDTDYLASFFDGNKADEVKMAEVLPTIPMNDASVLEKALSSAGVSPVNLEPASFDADDYLNASA